MANYYQNDLIIRGNPEELRRFQRDALPRKGEQTDSSWGGHSEGPLSFFSLLPPPTELQCDAARSGPEKKLWHWQMETWGCLWPDSSDVTLTDNCLEYHYSAKYFCAHNFVINVSKLYQQLAFRLVWREGNSGAYGSPVEYALLVVQNGVISHDFVEMSGKEVTSTLKGLDGESSVFLDYFVCCDEQGNPDVKPVELAGSAGSVYANFLCIDLENATVPYPTELEDAKRAWPAVPEDQTVGDFLLAHGNRVALVVVDGTEVAAIYRFRSDDQEAFLSCIDWRYDKPLSTQALVFPWIAFAQRLAKERQETINPITAKERVAAEARQFGRRDFLLASLQALISQGEHDVSLQLMHELTNMLVNNDQSRIMQLGRLAEWLRKASIIHGWNEILRSAAFQNTADSTYQKNTSASAVRLF